MANAAVVTLALRDCPVPGCRGRIPLDLIDNRAGWCPACERRILQLRAVREELERRSKAQAIMPAVSGPQLLELLTTRVRTLSAAAKAARVNMKRLRDAVEDGHVPAVRIGTTLFVPLDVCHAWADERRMQAGRTVYERIVAALPRREREARNAEEIARLADVGLISVRRFVRTEPPAPGLRRSLRMTDTGRPSVGYWWQESDDA